MAKKGKKRAAAGPKSKTSSSNNEGKRQRPQGEENSNDRDEPRGKRSRNNDPPPEKERGGQEQGPEISNAGRTGTAKSKDKAVKGKPSQTGPVPYGERIASIAATELLDITVWRNRRVTFRPNALRKLADRAEETLRRKAEARAAKAQRRRGAGATGGDPPGDQLVFTREGFALAISEGVKQALAGLGVSNVQPGTAMAGEGNTAPS